MDALERGYLASITFGFRTDTHILESYTLEIEPDRHPDQNETVARVRLGGTDLPPRRPAPAPEGRPAGGSTPTLATARDELIHLVAALDSATSQLARVPSARRFFCELRYHPHTPLSYEPPLFRPSLRARGEETTVEEHNADTTIRGRGRGRGEEDLGIDQPVGHVSTPFQTGRIAMMVLREGASAPEPESEANAEAKAEAKAKAKATAKIKTNAKAETKAKAREKEKEKKGVSTIPVRSVPKTTMKLRKAKGTTTTKKRRKMGMTTTTTTTTTKRKKKKKKMMMMKRRRKDTRAPERRERECRDCGTTSTPQWRGGPEGARTLCNACGVRWRKSQGGGDR